MGLAAFGGNIWIPPQPGLAPWGLYNMAIDAAGELAAGIMAVPRTGTIAQVFLRTGTVAASQSLDVGLQTVDAATGDPTGSMYGGSAVGTIAAPASNTNYIVTLGTAATATQGDLIAVVVGFTSAVGNLQIMYLLYDVTISFGVPYIDLYTGSWTKTPAAPNFALGYDDGSWPQIGGIYPQPATGGTLFNSGSTPDERGNAFTLTFRCRVVGWWCRFQAELPAAGLTVRLYDENDVVLFSSTPDPEISVNWAYGAYYVYPVSQLTLDNGVTYRLTVIPNASNVSVPDWQWPDADMLGALPLGANCIQTQRTNGGAWTDNADRRVLIGLVIDQLDEGMAPAPAPVTPPSTATMGDISDRIVYLLRNDTTNLTTNLAFASTVFVYDREPGPERFTRPTAAVYVSRPVTTTPAFQPKAGGTLLRLRHEVDLWPIIWDPRAKTTQARVDWQQLVGNIQTILYDNISEPGYWYALQFGGIDAGARHPNLAATGDESYSAGRMTVTLWQQRTV